MKVQLDTEKQISNEACKAATGRTLDEWYAYFDERGGPSVGRRDINRHVYFDLNIRDDFWNPVLYVEYERVRGVREKDGRIPGYSVCSTKTIKASADTVYKAFLDAATLDKWLGPGTKITAKDGGSMENGDGNKAEILRLREGKDIRMNWLGDEPSFVEVMFKETDGKTGITLNHTRIQTKAEMDGLRAAWSDSLGKLKSLLEAS